MTASGRSPGRERLQRGARGRVALAAAGVAARHALVRRARAPGRRARAGRGAGAGPRRLRLRCPNGRLQAARAARAPRPRGRRPRRSRARRRSGVAPRAVDRADVRGVEPADREPRRRHVRRRPLDVVESGGRAARLRRRRVHRPDGEVVDVGVGVGRRALLRARASSGRRSGPGPTARARRGDAAVVLADVHAVGARRPRRGRGGR